MKRIFLVVVALMVLAGCSNHEESDYLVSFQIGMNSMEVIPPANLAEPLVVRLTGIIGPDTRYSFDHAVVHASAGKFELTLFGVRNDDPQAYFIPTVVEWNGQEFVKQPPHSSSVRVILHQPDGSTLEEVVGVGK